VIMVERDDLRRGHGRLRYLLCRDTRSAAGVPGGDHWATIDAGKDSSLVFTPASEHQPAPGTAGGVTIGLAVDQPIEHVVSTLTERGVVPGPIIDEGMLKWPFSPTLTATRSISRRVTDSVAWQ
jgi:hypothetical protein